MQHGGRRAFAGRKGIWETEEKESKVLRVPKSIADILSEIKDSNVPVNRINTALRAVLRLSSK